jgi:hypothetical protein
MVLTYRSTIAEKFKIIGEDSDGSRRVAVATKLPGQYARWGLELQHPSGRTWRGDYTGTHILDALGELLNSKEGEYKQSKNRGHRPEPKVFDHHRDPGGVAPITGIPTNKTR